MMFIQSYKDNSNDLWFSTISNGVYKYTENGFANYNVPTSVIVFLKDKTGNIWLGWCRWFIQD